MKPLNASLASAVLLASLAIPVTAAEAQPFILDLNDPSLDAPESAFWTDACGFEVTADLSGHIIFHDSKSGAVDELTIFHITARLTSESGSYHLVDVGPDILYTRKGVPYVAVVGRSITGSNVIGRVTVNLETGETIAHGKLVGDEVFGDFTRPICRALAPTS